MSTSVKPNRSILQMAASAANTAVNAANSAVNAASVRANTAVNAASETAAKLQKTATEAVGNAQDNIQKSVHQTTEALVGPKKTKPVDVKAKKQASMQIAKTAEERTRKLPLSERKSLLKIEGISEKLDEIRKATADRASKFLAEKVAHHATKSLQYHSKEQEAMGDPEKQSEKNKARALKFANQLLAGAAMQALMTQVGQTEAENMVSLALDNQMIEEANLANQGGKRKRKHKRKTMKRKSNKRKHKKRHATKKRKHKKRHQTKKRKLKKKAHKKKAHKKKHRRTRKQRGGACGCGLTN